MTTPIRLSALLLLATFTLSPNRATLQKLKDSFYQNQFYSFQECLENGQITSNEFQELKEMIKQQLDDVHADLAALEKMDHYHVHANPDYKPFLLFNSLALLACAFVIQRNIAIQERAISFDQRQKLFGNLDLGQRLVGFGAAMAGVMGLLTTSPEIHPCSQCIHLEERKYENAIIEKFYNHLCCRDGQWNSQAFN